MLWTFCVILLSCFQLGAQEVALYTFSQLDHVQADSKIQIRGFLYPAAEEKAFQVLAEEPNVRSCCLERLVRKVEVFGLAGSAHTSARALLVEGTWNIDPKSGAFQLLDARLIEEGHNSTLAIVLILTFILVSCLMISIKLRGKGH